MVAGIRHGADGSAVCPIVYGLGRIAADAAMGGRRIGQEVRVPSHGEDSVGGQGVGFPPQAGCERRQAEVRKGSDISRRIKQFPAVASGQRVGPDIRHGQAAALG